jgi:hypothetical protein
MSSPRHAGGPIRWARNLSGVHEIGATASPVDGGNIVVILWGQGLRCIEAGHVTCH